MSPSDDALGRQSPAAAGAGALLTVDLEAICKNYRRLRQELGGCECAAVVKADAYGLGMTRVGPALAQAGARTYFTAQLQEAVALRESLAATEGAPRAEARIFVLNGLGAGPLEVFRAHDLHPVLNSLGEIDAWSAAARSLDRAHPAAVHVDTGMSRLGLPPEEFDSLAADPGRLDGVDLRFLMSHLACADTPEHPLNARQLAAFETARARLPGTPASLCNSAGIFLGSDYHYQLARPGVALYGVNPIPGKPNPMTQVVRLQGKILQVREIDAPQTVGYGATFRVAGPTRIATVAVGYADGFLRSLSNRAWAWIGDQRVPVVGRVSMDLITLDVSAVSGDSARLGAFVDLIGPEFGVGQLAEAAGTIGYEILTALGQRYHRVYLAE